MIDCRDKLDQDMNQNNQFSQNLSLQYQEMGEVDDTLRPFAAKISPNLVDGGRKLPNVQTGSARGNDDQPPEVSISKRPTLS